MLELSINNYYHCQKKSLIADYDIKTLTLLYQPIIGAKAFSLFLTLINECDYQDWISISKIEMLLNKCQLSSLELKESLSLLEGLSLIKTFRKIDSDELTSYIFEIYAPKTPNDFFKDPCYLGLLESSLGEKEVSRLKRYFKIYEQDKSSYIEISKNFKDVYNNKSLKLLKNKDLIYGRENLEEINNFDIKKFTNILKTKYHILNDNFDNETYFEIQRLALLFDFNEEVMAMFVSKHYSENSKVDMDEVYFDIKNSLITPLRDVKTNEDGYKVYDEENMFAKKVNLLNSTSPIEYFKLRSSSTPSPADVNIINKLSKDYSLNNGVINVIIDYTLENCNDEFPRQYCEKIASSLQRKKATNALEAINALTKKTRKTKTKVKEKEDEEVINSINAENDDSEDISSIMEGL